MAIRWDFKHCLGELEIENQKCPIRIYQGNAYAIFVNEWTSEKGEELYSMYNFFADKQHFQNCAKDKEWNYAEGWKKITLWKLPNDFWSLLKDLAKRGVTIEIKKKE